MSRDSVVNGGDEWSSATAASNGEAPRAVTVTQPPHLWLVLAAFAAILGTALALLQNVPASIVGWLFGGLVTILLWGLFIRKDGARLAEGRAEISGLTQPLQSVVLLLALVAVVANSWVVADTVARHRW